MSEKPNRARRSPQEKKKFSYERDCVNVGFRNDKASRKAIPARKAHSARSHRRGTTEILKKFARAEDDGVQLDAKLADTTLKAIRHTNWRKYRDYPLVVMLDDRPVKRHGSADRLRTRNIRDSAQAAIVLNAYEEELFARWNQMTADRKAAKKALLKAKKNNE